MPRVACLLSLLIAATLAGRAQTPRATPATVKPPIRGLVSMGAYKFVGAGGEPENTLEPLNAKAGIFGGLVIVASWAQLQPKADSVVGDGNVIDQAMAQVRAYNQRNPQKPLAVRLRVWGGFMAPEWVDTLGGPAIAATHKQKRRHLGRFWSREYRQAWVRLQQQLAARYDGWPLIREVAITSCMSFTAEPFFVPSEAEVQKPIRAAGFTEAAFKQCLTGAVDDYAAWKQTRLVLSVNPLRTEPNLGTGNAEFTMGIMRDCRTRLGVRCVFDNHNLDSNLPTPQIPLYALMKQLGPEIVYQTGGKTPANFEGTIKKGVTQGATSIELWQDYGGFPEVANATLERWATLIEANTTP
jgi:hypothetical protein